MYKFHVEMTCEGCSGAVKRVLGKLEGDDLTKFQKFRECCEKFLDKVTRLDIDLPAKQVEVESSLSREEVSEKNLLKT